MSPREISEPFIMASRNAVDQFVYRDYCLAPKTDSFYQKKIILVKIISFRRIKQAVITLNIFIRLFMLEFDSTCRYSRQPRQFTRRPTHRLLIINKSQSRQVEVRNQINFESILITFLFFSNSVCVTKCNKFCNTFSF